MRTKGTTDITPEIMTKVRKLHTNSVAEILISEALGISLTSTKRVIKLMTAAKNGEDIDSMDGNNHKKQKDFAKKFFKVEEKKKEKQIEEESKKQTLDDDFRDFAVRVLFALEYQNQLLEKLLNELGVETKGECK